MIIRATRSVTGHLWRGLALSLVLLWPASILSDPSDPAILIIAHNSVTSDEIKAIDLERIYLGKRTRWQDDSTVVPAMLKGGDLHEEFVMTYLDRTPSRFVTYWRQAVFTGKGVPPRSFADEAALREFVARTPGAVGYLRATGSVAGVKVLQVR